MSDQFIEEFRNERDEIMVDSDEGEDEYITPNKVSGKSTSWCRLGINKY